MADPRSDLDQVAQEYQRLDIARIYASPDAWRARAATLAGLLGVAGLALLIGLAGQAQNLSMLAKVTLTISGGSFLTAFAIFLFAQIAKTGSRPAKEFDSAQEYLMSEIAANSVDVKFIRGFVISASVFSVIAVAAAMLTVVIVAFRVDPPTGSVILDEGTRESLAVVCDRKLPRVTAVQVLSEPTSPRLRLRIFAGQCLDRAISVEVERSSAVLVEG